MREFESFIEREKHNSKYFSNCPVKFKLKMTELVSLIVFEKAKQSYVKNVALTETVWNMQPLNLWYFHSNTHDHSNIHDLIVSSVFFSAKQTERNRGSFH